MPTSTYKLYRCPKCKTTKRVFQGDTITSFPLCKKCDAYMEFMGNAQEESLLHKISLLSKKIDKIFA